MRIRYLSLTNFRNYARLEISLPERPLLLYGANAQGKTSLLEAVYLLATGTSPLASRDRQVIKWQAEAEGLSYSRVWGEIVRGNRTDEIEVVLEKKPLSNGSVRTQKTIRVNRDRKRRAEMAGLLNVVVFMPQDLEIVAGSPSVRRRYMDNTLCQVDGAYCDALDRYSEALSQRNAALRHLRDEGGNPNQLTPFEEILAHHGVAITYRRQVLLTHLTQRADRIHRHLTGQTEWLRLDYQPSFGSGEMPEPTTHARRKQAPTLPADYDVQVQVFQQALVAHRREAIARGSTVLGPHRDDVSFIAGRPSQGTHEVDLGIYGSRGQQRTAVLALKIAELEWMKEQTGEAPVLLLDEVLAELDATRRTYLLSQVNQVEQALLTATDLDMFSAQFREQALTWQVDGGIVTPDES